MSDNPMVKPEFHVCSDHSYPKVIETAKEKTIITQCLICGKVLSMKVLPKGNK